MAHNQLGAASRIGHLDTTALVVMALGIVAAIAIACGIAFSLHAEHASQAASPTPAPPQITPASNIKPSINQEKIQTMQPEPDVTPSTSSPGATNNSSSFTTVTINGHTETVSGNGSLKQSYTSADGHTNVHIAINNSSTSTEDGSSQ